MFRHVSTAWIAVVLLLLASWAPHGTHAVQRRRLASGATAKASPPITEVDYTIYKKKDQLLADVVGVADAHTDFMKVEDIARTSGNYSATIKVVTVEPGGFTARQAAKTRLLISFGQHGREYITSEVAIALLQALAMPVAQLKASVWKDGPPVDAIQQRLQQVVFKILPMENVNGRGRVEAGDRCERKNGRAVDINRNYAVDWGQKEKDYDPYEEYPGTHPFSEPEAQVVQELATGWKPQVWLNVHSGMEALFTPYDHRGDVPKGANADASTRILHALNKRVFGGRCAVGSGGKTVGYLAHGTATDWMWEQAGIPACFTWEIYGDNDAGYHDCFRMFNPITKPKFDEVVQQWTRAVLELVMLLQEHPGMAITPRPSNASSTPGAAVVVDILPEPGMERTIGRSVLVVLVVAFVVVVCGMLLASWRRSGSGGLVSGLLPRRLMRGKGPRYEHPSALSQV